MKPMLLLLSVLGFCIAAKGFDEFTQTFVKPHASLSHIAQCMRLLKLGLNAGSSREGVDDHRLADANLGASCVPPLKLNSKWRLSGRFSLMVKSRWMVNKASANTADHKVKAKRKSSYVNLMHCIRCSKHRATDKARRTTVTLNL
ncbi:uncharacterized protein [Physcomitrium patens]|uniref:uncharacterized protein isoform X2 n=1 Tax=Physcomitrium patens TaxID=3218 RepID=UPI000D17A658|nr:uncharacterized protein LOC112280376 isoform X2 [Physcomitrium patens]|eukprot:XP_024371586.1 uncharacterized protein LOC112280376 isoform X2 [Physcomitrella patens]